MVKQKPVSIKWQIVFLFIPIVGLWAYIRIEKLLYGFLLNLGLTGVVYAIMFGMIGIVGVLDAPLDGTLTLILFIAMYAIPIWLQVHFMLKWSRAWNEKVSHST